MNRQHAVALAYLASFALAISLLPAQCHGQQNEPALYGKPRAAALASSSQVDSRTLEASSAAPSFPSLRPRAGGDVSNNGEGQGTERKSSKIAAPTITVISSLAVVLGLFAALVWGSRRFGNGSQAKGSIPKGVLQSLGSTALDPRTRVTMLRCGNRILIVAQTASGVHPLSEIVHPEEVRRLTAACMGDSKQDFAEALDEIEHEGTTRGFAGNGRSNTEHRPRRSLFASA